MTGYNMKNIVCVILGIIQAVWTAAIIPTLTKSDTHKVDLSLLRRSTRSAGGQIGCMHMESLPGHLQYVSDGNTEVCGLYLIGEPNQVVEVAFLDFDVKCETGSVVAVFDGWELQGELFPGPEDHTLPMSERYTMYCSENSPRNLIISTQNVLLIQFKIPEIGEGFKVLVNFKSNPQPCNAVAMFETGTLTMKNYGQRRNCTTSIIYPEQIDLVAVDVGVTSEGSVLEEEIGLNEQCMNYGGGDYVQLLNGAGLDTALMRSKAVLCGMDSASGHNTKFVLGCQHSVVRMVSSGEFHNTVTFQYAPPLEPPTNTVC